MTAVERAAAQLHRTVGGWPAGIWDERLDPHWREIVCRVARLPVDLADCEWQQIDPPRQLKITHAMLNAHRVGRAMSVRGIS